MPTCRSEEDIQNWKDDNEFEFNDAEISLNEFNKIIMMKIKNTRTMK